MAKKDQAIVVTISEMSSLTASVASNLKERQILRWLSKIVNKMPKRTDKLGVLVDSIIDFSELLNTNQIEFDILRKLVNDQLDILPIQIKLDPNEVIKSGFEGSIIGVFIKHLERYVLSKRADKTLSLQEMYDSFSKSSTILLQEVRNIISANDPIYTDDENEEFNDFIYESIKIKLTKYNEISIEGSKSEFQFLKIKITTEDNILFYWQNELLSDLEDLKFVSETQNFGIKVTNS